MEAQSFRGRRVGGSPIQMEENLPSQKAKVFNRCLWVHVSNISWVSIYQYVYPIPGAQ